MADSEEYKNALALVNQYNSAYRRIKTFMKNRNLRRHMARDGNGTLYVLEFAVNNQMRVMLSEIPAEVRMCYTRGNDVWRIKNCAKINLSERS